MLREKAVTLLKIRPEEMHMSILMAVLFFLVQAGIGVGDSVAFALFVSKNAPLLPYMYVPMGVIVFLVSLSYTASLGRFKNAQVVIWFLSGFALLMLGEWMVAVFFQVQITKTFWLTVNSMGIILGTLIWTAAGEVCDARQAKRLFPVFASMGILGSIMGNLFTKVLSQHVGMNNMILVYAVLLGGALITLRAITKSYFKPEPPSWAGYNFINDLRVGFDYVRGSGLFRLLAVCAILYSMLFFTVTFVFSISVATHYAGDQTQLVGFKGLFNSASALFSFLVSLIIANRLYARIGIVNSILLMPVTYLIGFLGSYVLFGFGSLVSLRLDRKSTRLNSSHERLSRMPSSA